MAYTDPKTWSPGDVLTAAELNTYVRDNTDWLATRPQVRCSMSGSQSIAGAGAEAAIAWGGSDVVDTDSMHDPASNNTRITFTTGGTYLFGFHMFWSGHADGSYRAVRVRKNGAAGTIMLYSQHQPDAASSPQGISCEASDIAVFSPGDYIEVYAFQSSGSAINIGGANEYAAAFFAYQIGV